MKELTKFLNLNADESFTLEFYFPKMNEWAEILTKKVNEQTVGK